jgi:alginate O-acetyltransferase complex protein AlgI
MTNNYSRSLTFESNRYCNCCRDPARLTTIAKVQPASAAYYIFIAAVFFLYWTAARHRLARLAVILLASYFFCARFGIFYVVLLPICSSIDYAVGLGLMRFERRSVRRLLVGVSVALNLALLAGSRHMPWFLAARHGATTWDWIFPLGLSFYVFQALTYTIDLYRRDGGGTTSLLAHLSAVSFFPTLQAGPITRVSELLKQFAAEATLTRAAGAQALFLIGLGLVKKFLIADYLGDNFVNRVFDTPRLYSGAEALLAVYAYSVQLYCDFSGYTDIARGTAMLLGIRLPINFDRPYLAANPQEFWRRWHITFSNWLRDYLYFSMPGKRSRFMPYLNLVITMVLGGLWHGITWTFATWGLLHGLALAGSRRWQAARKGRPTAEWSRPFRVFATYQFVCLTWVFFRASDLANALDVLGRIASLSISFENVTAGLLLALLVPIAAQFVSKDQYGRIVNAFAASPVWVHAAALLLVAVAIELLAGNAGTAFVYSRF